MASFDQQLVRRLDAGVIPIFSDFFFGFFLVLTIMKPGSISMGVSKGRWLDHTPHSFLPRFFITVFSLH